MRRKTTTILAIAVTASAAVACGGTSGATVHQTTRQELADELAKTTLADAMKNSEHFAPLCDGDGYPLPGNINNKESSTTNVGEFCQAIGKGPDAPAPAPTTVPTPTPAPTPTTPVPTPPPAACDRTALNQELAGTMFEEAMTKHAHFRCLCDDKGYPLVGNINNKGTSASAFCKALQEKGLL